MRGDRGFTLDDSLGPYTEASEWFVSRVRAVPASGWSQPGVGEWTVLELAAHTSRAYTTIADYVRPPAAIDVSSAAEYYRRALSAPDVDADIAERGRSEAVLLGADPVNGIEARAAAALHTVAAAPPGAVCVTRGGTLALGDFLATRVVELVVHTLDLCAALGHADAEPPAEAAQLTMSVVAALASDSSPAVLLRALTGRGALVPGYNVFD